MLKLTKDSVLGRLLCNETIICEFRHSSGHIVKGKIIDAFTSTDGTDFFMVNNFTTRIPVNKVISEVRIEC